MSVILFPEIRGRGISNVLPIDSLKKHKRAHQEPGRAAESTVMSGGPVTAMGAPSSERRGAWVGVSAARPRAPRQEPQHWNPVGDAGRGQLESSLGGFQQNAHLKLEQVPSSEVCMCMPSVYICLCVCVHTSKEARNKVSTAGIKPRSLRTQITLEEQSVWEFSEVNLERKIGIRSRKPFQQY